MPFKSFYTTGRPPLFWQMNFILEAQDNIESAQTSSWMAPVPLTMMTRMKHRALLPIVIFQTARICKACLDSDDQSGNI